MGLSQQPSSRDKQFWKAIWSLRVPQKVKNLLYMASLSQCHANEGKPSRTHHHWRPVVWSLPPSLRKSLTCVMDVYGCVMNLIFSGLSRSYGIFEEQRCFWTSESCCHGSLCRGKMPSSMPSHASRPGHNGIRFVSINRPLLFIRYLNSQRNDLQNLYPVRSLQLPRYGLQLIPGAAGNLHHHQSL